MTNTREKRWRSDRSGATALSACVTLVLAAFLLGCGWGAKVNTSESQNPPRVPVVKVTRGNLIDKLEIAGEFQPYQEINVYAKVSGYIRELHINWGSHVSKGQILAVLEIPELQQQLQVDEAGVHRSEQDLARYKEELTRAESNYNVAHLSYTRLADVQKARPELVAQEEVDI